MSQGPRSKEVGGQLRGVQRDGKALTLQLAAGMVSNPSLHVPLPSGLCLLHGPSAGLPTCTHSEDQVHKKLEGKGGTEEGRETKGGGRCFLKLPSTSPLLPCQHSLYST